MHEVKSKERTFWFDRPLLVLVAFSIIQDICKFSRASSRQATISRNSHFGEKRNEREEWLRCISDCLASSRSALVRRLLPCLHNPLRHPFLPHRLGQIGQLLNRLLGTSGSFVLYHKPLQLLSGQRVPGLGCEINSTMILPNHNS